MLRPIQPKSGGSDRPDGEGAWGSFDLAVLARVEADSFQPLAEEA